jgi:predicted ATP-grasp superfamily ATP-dependent carboligase
MRSHQHLLIFGASARAAAFSALRAGLRPWCADLFADADLQAVCPAYRISPRDYPHAFVQAAQAAPPGPWMYAGGLENRPGLVRRLSRRRALWGNDAKALRGVRSRRALHALFQTAGVPCPDIHLRARDVPPTGHWLVKPRAASGGAGIRPWTGTGSVRTRRGVFFQQYIEGESCAAVYVGDGSRARLLGVTRQLVGINWLHARPFAYCGSIGPYRPSPSLRSALEHLGNVLAGGAALRGIFGVDFIERDDVAWPVEVNPRYTASVEVLEYAQGISALALHCQIFDPASLSAGHAFPEPVSEGSATGVVGKAILFARAPVVFPCEGPWSAALGQPPAELPEFADIPPSGERIDAGRPVLTFFTRADSERDCLDRVRQIAADLDRRLWKD